MQLFESIKIKDGEIFNLFHHNRRMNNARRELFGCDESMDLKNFIPLTGIESKGLYKCKVIYSNKINKIELTPYSKKKVNTLKLVNGDKTEYSYKYLDRAPMNSLFDQRDGCDDIIIVQNNRITDSSVANLVFFDGTKWVTPSTPLLKGTMRQYLLESGRIVQEEIKVDDLKKFEAVILINAMLDFETSCAVEISNIS